MASVESDKHASPEAENQDGTNFESAENFHRFICDLFEKNGILSDLRAYLRKHIVTVLKGARTGDPPACQKHFTQRLELTYQALNILVAEYLLCLDFTYSLSVFVSEIPLANMVFSFARHLLQSDNETNLLKLRFSDSDVWSLLNYLGIKCDSDNANNIVDMYKRQKQVPLLICILKCTPMYRKETVHIENSSDVSMSSSAKSSLSEELQNVKHRYKYRDKCKHYATCKLCQYRVSKLKGKYKKKKKCFVEMFEQLKCVYETETEMCKAAQDKRVLRTIQSHALQLKQQRDQLEESYKAREVEMENNIQQKKKFLWSLAQSLREQHQNMAKAMRAVKNESERLTAKEDGLKKQHLAAEKILKQRGEEMRQHITNELNILEQHLESMKRERDTIGKERSELENLKAICDSSKVNVHNETDELKGHYDLLKNEFSLLKKCIESTKLEPKCMIERSTITESIVLNNGQGLDKVKSKEDKVGMKPPNQVINDLKKHNNVNFSLVEADGLYHEFNRSSASSEGGDTGYRHHHEHLHHLQDENERLKTFVAQQRDRISELTNEHARLQVQVRTLQAQLTSTLVTGTPGQTTFPPRSATLWLPTTAPLHPTYFAPQRVNPSHSENVFGGKGGGEQLSAFPQARVVVPGDRLPFVGVVGTRTHDARRRVVNPWHTHAHARLTDTTRRPGTVEPSENDPLSSHKQYDDQTADQQTENPASSSREHIPRSRSITALKVNETREKSPQSLLREAKEKLKNKNSVKTNPPSRTREKSPTAVLREAKLRLRKLEIEAEAVEQSYLDYKRRKSDLKEGMALEEEQIACNVTREFDNKFSRSLQKLYCSEITSYSHNKELHHSVRADFDKYLREYGTKFNLNETHFKNRNTIFAITRPIPPVFSNIAGENETKVSNDYIETPLTVFRKLYHKENTSRAYKEKQEETVQPESPIRPGSPDSSVDSTREANKRRKESLKKAKFDKKAQMEILKQNINKIYNIKPAQNDNLEHSRCSLNTPVNENILRVEVISKNSNIVAESSPNEELLVMVNSSIDRKIFTSESDVEKENFSTQMTIVVSPKRSPKAETEAPALPAPEAEEPDYPDDFSADVDNYNCRSDYDNNSPISLPKSSDDENFWDS